jgi:CxxC-x17-CxxC domain-containing protein
MEEVEVAAPRGSDLHEAVCSSCGKEFKLTFKPAPDRLYYCKSCLKKIAKDEGIDDGEASKEGYRSILKKIIERNHSEKSSPKIIKPNQTVNLDD